MGESRWLLPWICPSERRTVKLLRRGREVWLTLHGLPYYAVCGREFTVDVGGVGSVTRMVDVTGWSLQRLRDWMGY